MCGKSMSNVRLQGFGNELARLEVYRVWSWAVRYAVSDTARASGQNRTVVRERNSGFENKRCGIKRDVLLMHWGCRMKTKPKSLCRTSKPIPKTKQKPSACTRNQATPRATRRPLTSVGLIAWFTTTLEIAPILTSDTYPGATSRANTSMHFMASSFEIGDRMEPRND
jgi:hypothetical protein